MGVQKGEWGALLSMNTPLVVIDDAVTWKKQYKQLFENKQGPIFASKNQMLSHIRCKLFCNANIKSILRYCISAGVLLGISGMMMPSKLMFKAPWFPFTQLVKYHMVLNIY